MLRSLRALSQTEGAHLASVDTLLKRIVSFRGDMDQELKKLTAQQVINMIRSKPEIMLPEQAQDLARKPTSETHLTAFFTSAMLTTKICDKTANFRSVIMKIQFGFRINSQVYKIPSQKQEQLSQYVVKVYDSYKGLPFKVQIDFGVLLQEKLDGNNYKYSARIPSLDNAFKHQLQTITDKKSLEQFKVDTFKYLGEVMERTYDDTKNLIVGIFNVMFATYKLIDTGARMSYLDKHVKQHSVHYIDSDQKICFNISTEMTKFNDTFNLVVNIYTYHEELEGKTDLLLISDGIEQHVMYVSNVEKLTGVLICPYCHDQVTILSDTNKRANEYFNTHVEKCKSSTHEPSILLHDVPMPICSAILNHTTIEYLMAYGLMDQFKAQRGFITYDFETVSDQVMKEITDQTTLLSQLYKLSIASTEVYPNRDKSYELVKRYYTLFDELSNNYQEQLDRYELPPNSSFVHQWLVQTFESAEQIYQCMKYEDENIPFDKCIKVLGWNSSRFDIALLWVALDCELLTMGLPIGSLNNTKSITVTHKKSHMKLQFIDADNLFGPMTLKACVKDYGDKSEHKDVFPYEIINSKNWNEVLMKTEPFEYEDFKSQLKGGYSITKDEYDQYLIDIKRFTNRLDYLKCYNINDTEIMVKQLMNLINTFEQFNIDVLHYISIASCAYATKRYSTYFPSKFNLESDKQTYYEDFDINTDYSNPNHNAKTFELTAGYWKNKCYHYKQQDYKAGRETKKTQQLMNRQDNELPHTKDNCLPACVSCNIAHANKDPKITSLHIKMRQYAIKHNLPMTISDERIYKLLRECITGGLAALFHRENIAVISEDNENVATHVFALDGNSLYPSSYSSVKNENIPQTDHRMYMAGRSKFYSEKPNIFKNCIDQRKEIVVAKIKGYFPKSEYNNLLVLPSIFRNIEIQNKEEVIGEYMYSQAQKHSLPMTKKDRKLTILLNTNGQFMIFNNYYLWLLIVLGFVITDYKAIAVFEKNAAYEPFLRTMMNLRIQAILAGSTKEKFYKLIINSSYGYDTLNTEKFGKIKMLDKAGTFIAQHHPNHMGTKRISANRFAVQIKPKTATCFTSIQSGVFKLDNAKYWYLNYIYNFIYKCLNRKRFHFVLADTDSIYIAIAGDPNKDRHQQFESIVTDKQFYDQHVYNYLPDPNIDIYDYKKILGFGIENEGYELTSLGPQCYSMIVNKWNQEKQQYEFKPKITSKGINKSQDISHIDYVNVINKDIVKKGINGTLKIYDNIMSSIQVEKYALTGFNNKSIVLRNQCCCPYIKGLTAKDYIIKDQ
ncbi:MAG: hypothetical protein EZS28_001487 [Streblomastix strix]|uniref:DNA-directed DNA polymerase n=1 Tax=Streblomastix strix TaxID=222440 RepID=A0A5J4X805_9EUKA|nr:MAG: hypothetical protein EZS28_001487 [Streblomastix strix]